MELSDLVVFDRNLLTVDDRTGILYKVRENEILTRRFAVSK